MTYTYCPKCSKSLELNSEQKMSCSKCNFIHYNNPLPVAATVIPFSKYFKENEIITRYSAPINQEPKDTKILLVQRGVQPHKEGWCLPCGFIDSYETPILAAKREALEETGVNVNIETLLYHNNPMPGDLNQILSGYLTRPISGIITPGDDALDARLFRYKDIPKICFSSHQEMVEMWFSGEYKLI